MRAFRVPAWRAEPDAVLTKPTGLWGGIKGYERVACHLEEFPIEVEPHGTNTVKITMGGVSRIVYGVRLVTAINEAIDAFRKHR